MRSRNAIEYSIQHPHESLNAESLPNSKTSIPVKHVIQHLCQTLNLAFESPTQSIILVDHSIQHPHQIFTPASLPNPQSLISVDYSIQKLCQALPASSLINTQSNIAIKQYSQHLCQNLNPACLKTANPLSLSNPQSGIPVKNVVQLLCQEIKPFAFSNTESSNPVTKSVKDSYQTLNLQPTQTLNPASLTKTQSNILV